MTVLEKGAGISDPPEDRLSGMPETPTCAELDTSEDIATRAKVNGEPTTPLFREEQLGVWTLYFPLSDTWQKSIPKFGSLENLRNVLKNARAMRRFVVEVFSLGPLFFSLYFVTSILESALPSVQVYNDSQLMDMAERALLSRAHCKAARKEFERVFTSYMVTIAVGWVLRRIRMYCSSIVEQRISLHFKKRCLLVESQLDLGTAEDPLVQAQLSQANGYTSNASSVFRSLMQVVSIASETIALLSTLKQLLDSHRDVKLFGLACLVHPIVTQINVFTSHSPYYAMVTNPFWLRMKTLYELGTTVSYKKEVLGAGIVDYINSEYSEAMSDLGDTSNAYPDTQLHQKTLFGFSDISGVFRSSPLFLYALNNIYGWEKMSLSSLIVMQQITANISTTIWRIVFEGKNLSKLFNNIAALYAALDIKPKLKDGNVTYPDSEYMEQKGMGIEFKGVNFGYPSSKRQALKDLSFRIEPGQLCVIVGENGCGKSTTINLITRLYDCDSGDVLVDSRPVRDYRLSTLRAAANIVYQDYHHLPLTIKENLLLGRSGSGDYMQDVENAAKLGGAYDFVQKLPLKFETNLEPRSTGYPSWGNEGDASNKYKSLAEREKSTQLSGGEWQRLALSRTFMKNSQHTRLLCYDEPSASLDPKAEYEIFERLRKLRGEKTMIFVTHRFGHLTKHADLIIYLKDGSVLEQGTHKSLLAQGGEYANMYNIQSQAFAD